MEYRLERPSARLAEACRETRIATAALHEVSQTREGSSVRKTVARLSVLAVSLGIAVVGQVQPVSAAIDCSSGTKMDIGYTIKDGAYIKGSASYTSCPNRAIHSAEIVLQTRIAIGGWSDVSQTRVTISGIVTPSQKSYSFKDLPCRADTMMDWRDWRAKAVWKHTSGTTTKYSNVLRTVADCRP
ncbi:hypothetical protein AB0392_30670 [Nonomuraea angiospora]|uniref:hypothetical protein n=1 Tax=Nonomuraea angiospora TaxID=46172 RepID=UPI00344B58CF